MPKRNPKRRSQTIDGQFAWHLVDMLRSPAFAVLSLSGRRVLDRLEIELADHGGTNNGNLICTFDDFSLFGIHRHAIGPAIREVDALGFAEVVQKGRAGNGEHRLPNVFRLTYRHTKYADPTDDWRKIKTHDEAKVVAKKARNEKPKKRKPSGGIRTDTSDGIRTENRPSPVTESVTTGPVMETALLSISREGNPDE